MIELPITKDITKYKPKLLLGLTTRQVVCTVITLVLVVPAYLILSKFFIKDVVYITCLVVAVPPILCGYVQRYELPYEVFAKLWINSNLLTPKVRKYQQINTFEEFFDRFDNEGNLILEQDKSKKTNTKNKKNVASIKKNQQVSSDPDLFCAN